jgi:hypothetical protein
VGKRIALSAILGCFVFAAIALLNRLPYPSNVRITDFLGFPGFAIASPFFGWHYWWWLFSGGNVLFYAVLWFFILGRLSRRRIAPSAR